MRFDFKTRTGLVSQALLNAQAVSLVQTNLVMYLDAAVPSSYPGTGTSWTDLSTSGNNATLINGPTFSTVNGGTIVFDGTNDYVQAPIINLAANGTVSFWFYKTGTGTPSGNVVDLCANVTGDGFFGWSLGLNTSTNKLDFYVVSSGVYGVENFSIATIANNTWYNVTVTYNGVNKIIYINGFQDSSFSSTVTGTNTTTQWGIASRVQTPLRVFQGYIPVVLLYNRALTAAEVLQNYNILKSRYFAYDPDAQAFFDRVTTAGGTLTTTEKNAVSALVLDLKISGVWNSMQAIYPMVGGSAASCAQNLKSSSFTGTFSGGWTFASTGATPNGTNAYMSMGFVPSTALASASSSHLSYYSRTQNFGTNSFDWGTYDGTNEFNLSLGFSSFTNNKLTVNYTYPSNAINAANNTSTQGFAISSRTSTTSLKLYYNNATIGTNTTTLASSRPTSQMWLGAENSGGANYSPRECAFASIGSGLLDADATNLYTNVLTFQTSLSRNV